MAKKKRRRRKSKARRFFGALMKTFVFFIFAGMIGAGAYALFTISTADRIDPANIYDTIDKNSYIYDMNGDQIDTLHYAENRRILDGEEIPKQLEDAFIAIEDKTFYEHHGFNLVRMFGAVLNAVTGKSDAISGTSTITQQLARNVYLSDTKSVRSIKRKLIEMYYAWQIEQALSKDEILTAYLNTIYLGYGNYGVDAAARTYFSKEASELSLAQCAALAALPQAPDTYALLKEEGGDHRKKIEGTSLYSNDASGERRNLVLSLMAQQGYITADEAEAAHVKMSEIIDPSIEPERTVYTYVSDYVSEIVSQDLMETYGMTEDEAVRMVNSGGLNIYTTIDPMIQNIITDEFRNDSNFPHVYGTEDKAQAAMVVSEVGTGKILAMVGGRNASGSKLFNRATSPRQPGSSIKPLSVYAPALQKSYEYASENRPFPFVYTGYDRQGSTGWGRYITSNSLVVDEKLLVNGKAWPQNVTRSYSGKQTFRTALQKSINTCAVKILCQVGTDYSIKTLENFGITTLVTDDTQPVNDINTAALGLGAMTYGTTPLEMSLAYAVFPNGGVYNSPVCYTKVTDAEGEVLLEGKSETHKVLDEGVAWIMTDILKSVVSKGIGKPAAIYGVEYGSVGGKTGTTDDKYDIWFNGFTPKYSVALWVGSDKNFELSQRSEAAATLWSKIVRQFPNVTSGTYPAMPANVTQKFGDYFTAGTEPEYGEYLTAPKRKSSSDYRYGSGSGSSDLSPSESTESSSSGSRKSERAVSSGADVKPQYAQE